VSLPGVPNEMKGLLKGEVLPRIKQQFKLPFIIHKTLMTYGQGESLIAERIEDFENNLPSFIKLAYLPNYGRVRLRLSAKGDDKKLLEDTLQEQIAELYKLIPDIISGFDEGGKIEDKIGALLTQKGKTICTAESLTGGKIASTIVSVQGSSAYYKGSFVAYSAGTKISLLGVSSETITKYSVVSKEVAVAMAKGAKEKLQTNYALAVTGNAGPTADHNDKGVGVVFIALATDTEVFVEEFNFGKPRGRVIDKTVNKSLEMLQKEILKNS
jgi:nicotinamide-nucleotide amidase